MNFKKQLKEYYKTGIDKIIISNSTDKRINNYINSQKTKNRINFKIMAYGFSIVLILFLAISTYSEKFKNTRFAANISKYYKTKKIKNKIFRINRNIKIIIKKSFGGNS